MIDVRFGLIPLKNSARASGAGLAMMVLALSDFEAFANLPYSGVLTGIALVPGGFLWLDLGRP